MLRRVQTLIHHRRINTDPHPRLDPTTVLSTLSTYSNDWAGALDFFHWAEAHPDFHHTVATFDLAISILGKAFEFDGAWALLRRMPQPHHSSFRALFNRYAAARLIPDALRAFETSADYGLRDEVCFHHLVDALCDRSLVVEAVDICFGKNPPFPPTTKTYNMVLRGWYKMRWWRRCWEFWEKMDEDGVEKDLHSYSIYMNILSKAGKPWRAVRVYKEIRKKGIVLDVVAYNVVVHAVGLANGVDYSIRMYREMMELGCRPNVVTYNTVVKLLCVARRFAEAYGFLDRMREMGCEPNVITFHCIFQYLLRPKEVLWLFDRMLASGCRPSMDTYVMLLKKFGRWGCLPQVFHVWKVMEEHGDSPDSFAYNALIDALMQNGMIEMAREYDEEMLVKGLSPKPRKELGTKSLVTESEDSHDDAFEAL